MEWTRPLNRLRSTDLGVAGGKGSNLGELTRAGFPVPAGFVVLMDAYRYFVEENELQEQIETLAGGIDPGDVASVESASVQIRSLFTDNPIPEELVAAVLDAYRRLGETAVAVRSSATAEDLPGASFAGQQETYLNVAGADELVSAVRNCWSSLWTPRAISYRARQGIAPGSVALAVVVQRLIAADVAGVLFTVNPVNNNRRQLVISASWGFGEAVVSGQVTPDEWVINRDTREVIDRTVAEKKVMTRRVPGGTEMVPVPPDDRCRPSLNSAEVDALTRLGERVADYYGAPQDIEWALLGDAPYLLQSRPITSLFPIPGPRPDPDQGLRVYFSFNGLQGLVAPLTPMGASLFRQAASGVSTMFRVDLRPGQLPPGVKVGALRLWIDVTPLLRHPRGAAIARTVTGAIDMPMHRALNELLEREPRLAPTADRFPIRPRPGLLVRLLLQLFRTIAYPEKTRDRTIEEAEEAIADLERQAGNLDSERARFNFFANTARRLLPMFLSKLVPLVAVGIGSRFFIEGRLAKWGIDPALLQPVLRSLPYNPTIEMDLELWQVSRQLLAEGAGPNARHPAVKAFLKKYGHRGVREIDVGAPRWHEDPEHILNVLSTYLQHGEEQNPEEQFKRGAEEAERAARELVALVRSKAGRLRATLVRFVLRRLRELGGVRERPKFLLVRLFDIFRQVLLRAGKGLVSDGYLDRPDDIFYVSLPVLRASFNGDRDGAEEMGEGAERTQGAPILRDLVRRNREYFEAEQERRSIPQIVTSEGETLYGREDAGSNTLTGAPVSAGTYEGPVRIVLEPRGARLEPGEVLVAPSTDPAWTPLFMSAGALVMEIGGMMSHGSVVAREYGIPAVVGVEGATIRLHTGQLVRVDGENGLVTILEDGAEDSGAAETSGETEA